MRWALAVFSLLLPLLACSPGTAAAISRAAIRENSFDRDECYRVRDLTLVREDIRIYLTDGHLIFSKPVAGRRIAAVFTADVEGGDGEVILMPPDRAERASLASYIDSPNLNEHFRAAVFLFTGDDLRPAHGADGRQPRPTARLPEMGAGAGRGVDAGAAQSRRELSDAADARPAGRTRPHGQASSPP